uniref:Uncharacterized protein n=1 Tax=Parascaris univalens TaxID=6257 RepID=A0A915CBD7_PARUN
DRGSPHRVSSRRLSLELAPSEIALTRSFQ